MATEWKHGDVVVLKSGGPKMTITDTVEHNGLARLKRPLFTCAWFSGSDVKEHNFDADALEAFKAAE